MEENVMKKVYSFALIIAAVLSSLTSCQKDSLIPQDEPVAEGLTSFVVYLDNEETKTTIDGLKVSWKDGDQVNVNGSIYEATVDKSNPAAALFTLAKGQTAPKAASIFRAYYPASAFISTSYTQRYTLQETQTYNGNDVSSIDYLYGQSAGPEIPASFTLKHVTGILALDLVGEDKVTSIQITAPTNNYLYGTIANLAYSTAGKISYSSFATSYRGLTVTLNCGAGVQLNKTTPKRFYISLPEKTYPSLEIKINTASGKTMTINSTKSCPVTKGKLFTLPQIEVKFVTYTPEGQWRCPSVTDYWGEYTYKNWTMTIEKSGTGYSIKNFDLGFDEWLKEIGASGRATNPVGTWDATKNTLTIAKGTDTGVDFNFDGKSHRLHWAGSTNSDPHQVNQDTDIVLVFDFKNNTFTFQQGWWGAWDSETSWFCYPGTEMVFTKVQ